MFQRGLWSSRFAGSCGTLGVTTGAGVGMEGVGATIGAVVMGCGRLNGVPGFGWGFRSRMRSKVGFFTGSCERELSQREPWSSRFADDWELLGGMTTDGTVCTGRDMLKGGVVKVVALGVTLGVGLAALDGTAEFCGDRFHPRF